MAEFPLDWTEDQKEDTEAMLKWTLKTLGEPIIDYEPLSHRRELMLEGIKKAKAEGKYKGRRPKKYDKKLFVAEHKRWKNGEIMATSAMRTLGLKPNTFYRRVRDYEVANGIREE